MSAVVKLQTPLERSRDAVVANLREFADRIEEGTVAAERGMLILQDRVSTDVTVVCLAPEAMLCSDELGLLQMAQHMRWDEFNRRSA